VLIAQPERVETPTLLPQRHRYGVTAQPVRAHRDAPAGEAAAPIEMFAAGDHVRHPKFGRGIVVSCQPSSSDYQIVVAFKGEAGIKKLLLSFAPLERVDAG